MGIVSIGLGLATVPLARNFFELGLAVLLIPVGTALLFPSTTSIVSHRAEPHQTGLVLGVQQAYGGAAFQHLGIRTPFWLAAMLMGFVWVFSGTVREEGTTEELSGEVETTILP
jgi:hypothetical protein